MNTAFVSAVPVLSVRQSSNALNTSFTSTRRAAAPVRRARMVMKSEDNKNIPQGFTLFSEQLNGRAAMMGFILAVATEAITGKGILGQLAALGDVSSIASALGLH